MDNRPLRLPLGHGLHSYKAGQVAASGAIYMASMPGDLGTLFGPARKLRDREFLLEIDGEQWLATPMPDLFMADDIYPEKVFDTGGICARTNGEITTIDFGLLRKAGARDTA